MAEGQAEKDLSRGKREDRKKRNSREKVVQNKGEQERKRKANLSLKVGRRIRGNMVLLM